MMVCKVINMRMLIALMILIAFSTGAQACWPPANTSENSGDDAEPVKAVEPVENEQDDATGEEQVSDGSNDPEGAEEAGTEVEVVAPVVDTVDQAVTEEPEIVQTPASQTVTRSDIPRSSGYGEARIIEVTATAVQPKDAASRSINNEPVSVTSGTNVTVEQIAEVNTDNNGNTGDNNSSYVAGVVLALVAITAGAVYYFRK